MIKHLPLLILALALTWGCDSKKSGEATASATVSATSQPSTTSATPSKTEATGQATATTAVAKPSKADKKAPSQEEIAAAIAAAKAASAGKNTANIGAAPTPVDPNFQAAAPADAKKTASGLAYKVLKAGTGKVNPKSTEHVTVHYTGWTTDGKVFDSSVKRGKPASFPLNGVIKGWTEGLQLMVEGEKTRFWIPAGLAYGEKPGGGRPAGLLIFDVELLSIQPAPDPVKLAKVLKDKACACKDVQCLQSLREDGMAMAMAMRSATPAQKDTVMKIQTGAKECVDKLVEKAGLGAPGNPQMKPGPMPNTPLLAKAKKIKDEVCACKDQACVATVSQKMGALRGEFAKATQEEKMAMQGLGMEIGQCIQKLMPKPTGLPGGKGVPAPKAAPASK